MAGVTVEIADDLFMWKLLIDGPEGTPFVGGKFIVNVDFSDNYPFKPPKIKFVTKIYHPNVKTDTGEICMQAIESKWVPTLNATFIVQAILTLLRTPTAENALEVDIATKYQNNYNQWQAQAVEWTAQYAKK
jgi:ubiquitin-protein ligase